MKKLLPYIVETLKEWRIKHEVHTFDSGAVMVDIWIGDKTYVIQIDGSTIGLSMIEEGTISFDVIPDQTFEDVSAFVAAFTSSLTGIEAKKTIVINGNNFSTLEGFYSEIDAVLTKNLSWETGHNLNAFNDLLRGGFGVHDYEEPIVILWQNSDKSKAELSALRDGETIYEILINIIREHEHIDFFES